MSTEKRKEQLKAPSELKKNLPLTEQQNRFIEESRSQLRDILNGSDSVRKVIITGPCSIHDFVAAKEYAEKLKALASEVSDVLFLVMRVYFEKPRTILGWKGLCLDPHLDGSHDIAHGIEATRQLLLNISEIGISTAAEFLTPFTAPYFEDLVTWGCIGSRTAESQTHRELASGLPMPIAFKNNTNGNIDIAVSGVLTSSVPHSYLALNDAGSICAHHSHGNSDSHIVLRGGDGAPNYSSEAIAKTLQALEQAELPSRLLVDCSHDNSNRNYEQQPAVFEAVLDQILAGNDAIKGMILESHLNAGKQKVLHNGNNLDYGVSITDSCLDWEATEALIYQAADALRNRNQYPLGDKGSSLATPVHGDSYASELIPS